MPELPGVLKNEVLKNEALENEVLENEALKNEALENEALENEPDAGGELEWPAEAVEAEPKQLQPRVGHPVIDADGNLQAVVPGAGRIARADHAPGPALPLQEGHGIAGDHARGLRGQSFGRD
jgi:hypothetical protein